MEGLPLALTLSTTAFYLIIVLRRCTHTLACAPTLSSRTLTITHQPASLKVRSRGHYVALVIVGAEYMTERAWEYIKADYYRRMKHRFGKEHHKSIPKFDVKQCANPPNFRTHHDDGVECRYVVGWFFVPSYMVELRSRMVPVSALDAAHMYHPAQGTIYVEATQDMLKRIHPVAIMAFLGAENWAGYRLMMEQELVAYGESKKLDPAGSGGVVIGDGAVSLRQQFEPLVLAPQPVETWCFVQVGEGMPH